MFFLKLDTPARHPRYRRQGFPLGYSRKRITVQSWPAHRNRRLRGQSIPVKQSFYTLNSVGNFTGDALASSSIVIGKKALLLLPRQRHLRGCIHAFNVLRSFRYQFMMLSSSESAAPSSMALFPIVINAYINAFQRLADFDTCFGASGAAHTADAHRQAVIIRELLIY